MRPGARQVNEAAGQWFARRKSDAWTDADQADLDAWLEADIAHRVALVRLEAAWEHAARMKALGAGVPAGEIPPVGSWGDTRFAVLPPDEVQPRAPVDALEKVSRRRVSRPWAVAAMVATIALSVAVGYSLKPSGDAYRTAVGGRDTLSLDDGSNVTLNTDTRIRVAFSETARRVRLSQGEAFFDVAKDAARPFVVEAGHQKVVAVGTQFSVRLDGQNLQVAVTQGKVRVERDGAPAELLEAGSIARATQNGVMIQKKPVADVEQDLSWRSGYVRFRDTSLADAVAEFNRYTDERILIEDPAVAGIQVNGNFRSDNVEAFLWLVQTGFPVRVEREDGEILLKRR